MTLIMAAYDEDKGISHVMCDGQALSDGWFRSGMPTGTTKADSPKPGVIFGLAGTSLDADILLYSNISDLFDESTDRRQIFEKIVPALFELYGSKNRLTKKGNFKSSFLFATSRGVWTVCGDGYVHEDDFVAIGSGSFSAKVGWDVAKIQIGSIYEKMEDVMNAVINRDNTVSAPVSYLNTRSQHIQGVL